jgi:hypothetical protein
MLTIPKEMKIKITLRFHLTLVRMASMKNTTRSTGLHDRAWAPHACQAHDPQACTISTGTVPISSTMTKPAGSPLCWGCAAQAHQTHAPQTYTISAGHSLLRPARPKLHRPA